MTRLSSRLWWGLGSSTWLLCCGCLGSRTELSLAVFAADGGQAAIAQASGSGGGAAASGAGAVVAGNSSGSSGGAATSGSGTGVVSGGHVAGSGGGVGGANATGGGTGGSGAGGASSGGQGGSAAGSGGVGGSSGSGGVSGSGGSAGTGGGVCGNGIVEPPETCDGPVTTTCASLGLGTGPVSCNATSCAFDTSQCVPAAVTCDPKLSPGPLTSCICTKCSAPLARCETDSVCSQVFLCGQKHACSSATCYAAVPECKAILDKYGPSALTKALLKQLDDCMVQAGC